MKTIQAFYKLTLHHLMTKIFNLCFKNKTKQITENQILKITIALIIYSAINLANGKSFEALAQAGSLDTTFANRGIDTTSFGGAYGQSVIIQSDKKIIVAGGGYNGSIYGVGLIRYLSDGSLDNTFGTKGKVYTDIGGISSWGNECKLQSDGKIVVAGISNTKSSSLFGGNIQNFLVARYNSDGSLDKTFNNTGTVVTGFNQKNAQAGSLAIQTDGKIVTAGIVDAGSNSASYDFAIVRYNSDGTLDNTFGNSGKVTTDFNKNNDIINSIKLQTDGKIVVAGPVSGSSSGTFYALARYNTDGSLDNTFGTNGKVTTTITNGDDEAFSVTILNDGKFIVTGSVGLDKVPYIGLIKYNSDGSLDTSFGTGGKVTTHAGNADSRGYSLVTQSDNKILITGIVADSNVSQKFLLVMRYNIDGKVDSLFGTQGKVKTAIGKKDDAGYSIALQTDKKIVVAGWTKDINDNYNYGVVRYNGDCDPPVITTNAPQTICIGNNITLNGSGADTYSWSNGISNGIAFTPTQGVHTYTVVGTNSKTNCKNSVTTTVTVNALPTVSASSSLNTICAGASVKLTGSGASTYSWSDGISNATNFTPSVTKTYTVTGTDANNCSNTATVSIKVNSLPTVTANASANTICSGASVTLTGSGANTYSWSDGINNNVAFNPSSTKTFTVTGIDANNCSNTNTITVYVNNTSGTGVTAHTSATSVCAGTSVTLTGSGATSYSWSDGVTDAVSFIPTTTKSYTVTGISNGNCSNSASIMVYVNALPTVTANASIATVCEGTSVTLTGSGANSYSWSDGVLNNVVFTPTATKTYTLTGTDANNCSNSAILKIIINPLPLITAIANANTICTGGSVILTGSGASTYTWSDGITNGVGFIPATTKTYTVTGKDVNNCTNTATKTITVNTATSLTVTANASATSVCAGSPVTLSGSGATSYSWSGNRVDGVPFIPSATDSYTVTGTNTIGCSAFASIKIIVNAIPGITAKASSNTICVGDSILLYGAGGSNYSWSNNVKDSIYFAPTSTQTYTVTTKGTNGCSGYGSTTVTVYTLSLTGLGAVASKTNLCSGDSVTLSGTGADKYYWTGGVEDKKTFSPLTTATYTLTGIKNNTCNRSSITIQVNKSPNVTAAVTPSSSAVCAETFVTLSGIGADAFVWSDSIIDGIPFIPKASHTYTIIGTTNNCSGTAIHTITVFPLPKVNITVSPSVTICAGDSIKLTASGAKTLTWSDNVINGKFFIPTVTKTYNVTAKDGNSCTKKASQLITVKSCEQQVGINELDNFNDFNLYPNPNNGAFTITASGGTYSIIDELGRTIQQVYLNNSNNYAVTIENLNSGIYFIVGYNNETITHQKIIVAK
jgi:uncharacterized delta-60 repeat protein